jgi:hypothetical protein
MEIAALTNTSLRLKGKQATLVINPTAKITGYSGALYIPSVSYTEISVEKDCVLFDGAGEYEVGGVKVSGITSGTETIYTISLDGIQILVGTITALERSHAKIGEQHIVIVIANTEIDPSFVTSFAPKVVFFTGDFAENVAKKTAKENIRKEAKYQSTLDKLPAEMEEIILQ